MAERLVRTESGTKTMVTVNLSLPRDLIVRLDHLSADAQCRRNKLVIGLLERALGGSDLESVLLNL